MQLKSLTILGLSVLLATPAATAQQKPAAKTTAARATGGPRLVEKVTAKPGEVVIPYEKYVLPNGMTVVVHEDHSDPIVHVDVTYHVGSARETIGKSGFAHFFEHMMFQGSDNVADEQHFKTVSAAGGTLNGSTNRDRTNYYETLPSNQLETALWLEADRMGFLLDAVTQTKFENQRSTVKNERGQNYDNRPYGLAGEMVSKNLYPYGHPYSWMTIGYLEDLDRSNVDDLKNFFLRWYGPNNATLTVGGDVKPADVVKLAEKYFGSIKRGPAVQNMKLPAPKLTQDRYVSYEDNVRFPLLRMVLPTVPRYHPDETALDALADILGGGNNSLLYQNLVKNQKAIQANAGHPTAELAGEFSFTAVGFPGKGLDSLEMVVRNSLREFEKRGVTDEDIQRFKATRETQTINGLSSVSGKVSELAASQTFTGSPNRITQELKAIRSLTKADVLRVYNQYLKGKPAVVLSVVPKGGKALIARADNYTISKDGFTAPKDEYAGLTYTKPQDTFNRSQQPKSGANPVVSVPAYWQQNFPNGLKIIGSRNAEIPTVTMQLTLAGGHHLATSPAQAGLAGLTAAMLNEGSQKYTPEQFSAALEKLGSSIDVFAGDDNTTIYVESLTKNLDATLALLQERLLRPRFDAQDFARVKKQTMEGIANQNVQPVAIANNTYNRLLYGSSDIMRIPSSGTVQSVQAFTLDDVKRFYEQYYAPNLTNVVVVGDVTEQQLLPKLGFLQSWAKKDVPAAATAATAPRPDKTRIYFVNKDGAAQSEIRIGYLGLPFDATGDYYRAGLANYVLGGAFNSRINLNLREDKGYTYGARSGFRGSKYAGPFTAQAGVRADATAASVKEFMKEMQNYRNGISDEELQFLQASIGQSDARNYETGRQKAAFLGRIVEYDLDKGYVQQQNDILKNLRREDVQALAQKYLPTDNMYIVVVGDRAKAFPGLGELGYEVVELDLEGNPVAAAPAPAMAPAAPNAAEIAKQMSDSEVKKSKEKTKGEDGKKKRKQKADENSEKVKVKVD